MWGWFPGVFLVPSGVWKFFQGWCGSPQGIGWFSASFLLEFFLFEVPGFLLFDTEVLGVVSQIFVDGSRDVGEGEVDVGGEAWEREGVFALGPLLFFNPD